MHRKETVIGPLLQQELGVETLVPTGFNTDRLGTFTREIPRAGSQLEAARLKAQQALQITQASLAISSEGSFGPHPVVPWSASDLEIVMLIDLEHTLEIVGQVLSSETNYDQTQVKTWRDAEAFAQQVGFPSHGLVLRDPEREDLIAKGIVDWQELETRVKSFFSQSNSGPVQIETDMRAMVNPTRMQVIRQATEDLIAKIQSICPNCGWPGFIVKQRRSGLPCGLCGLPTAEILKEIYHCDHCHYTQTQIYPQGKTVADPATCGFCNP